MYVTCVIYFIKLSWLAVKRDTRGTKMRELVKRLGSLFLVMFWFIFCHICVLFNHFSSHTISSNPDNGMNIKQYYHICDTYFKFILFFLSKKERDVLIKSGIIWPL